MMARGTAPEERRAVLRRLYPGEASGHTHGNVLGLSLTDAVAGMRGMLIHFSAVPAGCGVKLFRKSGVIATRVAG